ncbi:LCP family protein [Nonomuraea sp. NPDC005983]|uniref:LCP family protein n=1 Tax=Nonomuraea sp. NPDC005983 TaxID=3155595 RepID=UPI0033BBE42C
MDDLKMLRDLGRDLEHEPPVTLARQRQRLLRERPRRLRMGWFMAGLVAVATALAVAVPTLVLSGRQTVPPPVGARPAKLTGALNVLVIGSDTRQGEGNTRYGPAQARSTGGGGARSDTMMLVHLPEGGGGATVISFPRDSMVQIPSCGSAPPRRDMINSAFDTGGVSCAVATVEKLTKVRVDHFVVVDFTGFKNVVDALGGVEVKLRTPVSDKASRLKLPAGTSHLNGEQALGYMRLRHYGDGSDIQRIKRQVTLLRVMLAKARKGLTDPAKLRPFLDVVSRSVVTDGDLDLEVMYGLASRLGRGQPSFVMVPWLPDPKDQNRIVWKQPDAQKLFDRLK